jgi:hypothetical protein
MTDPSNAELLVHLQYLRQACDQTNNHLAHLNGRTRTAEQKIAVLEDRSDEAKAEGRKHGAIWGGAGAALGGIIWIWHALSGGN